MSRPISPALPSERLIGLEILRFVCALSVLVWHYQHFYAVGHERVGWSMQAQPAYALLRPFYESGWLGVQLFWSLSGFIFFWKYAEPVGRGEVSGRRFALWRITRLYPLHLATLLAVAALAAWYRAQVGQEFVYEHNTAGQFLLQLFMASEWSGRSQWSFNGPIWSVSVELLAYAVFFGACRLGLVTRRHLLAVVLATGALYASRLTAHPLVLCLFFFYLGGLAHSVARSLPRLSPARRALVLGSAALVLAVSLLLCATGRLRPMYLMTVMGPVLMLWLVQVPSWPKGWLRRAITGLGNTTYASYLLHFPLQLLVMNLVGGDPGRLPLHSPWWLAAYLLTTFATAALVFRAFESPMQERLRAGLGGR